MMEIPSGRTSESVYWESGLAAQQLQNGVVCFYMKGGANETGAYGQPTTFAALDEMNEKWHPTVAT